MAEWRGALVDRLAPLGLRPEREAEIVEELSQHLDDYVRALVAGGAAPADARATALADLDAPGELARRLAGIEARPPLNLPPPGTPSRGRWFQALWQDIRFSIRSLRRSPMFAAAVIVTLALTIGPTTAILSIGNWLLWRPAPLVTQPDRLAVVWFGDWREDGAVSPRRISELNLNDLRHASRTQAGIAGWQESSVSFAANGSPPRHVGSAHAAVNYFELLGVRPAFGRSFAVDDDVPPFGSPVVVLGDRLARGVFGSAEAAVGRPIVVNGRSMSVIGVMPPGFVGARPFSHVDVWFPSATYYHVRHFTEATMRSRMGRASSGIFYTFVVRLAPGATFEALQAELDVLVPALAASHPDENGAFKTTRARVYPGLGPDELQREEFAGLLRNLLIVGGVLLLLGCANVANLLISRGVRRQHERAVRVALGASRGRLVQLLLTESCVLAVAGAAIGVGLAVWFKELLRMLLLPGAAGAGVDIVVPMDVRILVVTLGVSIACGLIAGLVPAFVDSPRRVGSRLGSGNLRTSRGGSRVRVAFAVIQLALSLALVTNAMLLVATLRNLAATDVGFDPRGVSVHFLDLGSHGYVLDRAMAYDRDLLERVSADQMFQAVSLSSGVPGFRLGTRVRDPHGDEKATIGVSSDFVTEGYFKTTGIPILRGRTFTRVEAMTSPPNGSSPVVVGESLARRLFGNTDPLGQFVKVPANGRDPAHDLVVIGVSRDVRAALAEKAELLMYAPFSYGGGGAVSRPVLMVRSDRPTPEVGDRVQAHATAIDASLPPSAPQLLTTVTERGLTSRRVFASALTLLGALGFFLAAVGLYGLLAQSVSERAREFGIRIAVGSGHGRIFALVIRQAAWIGAIGTTAGLALAYWGTRMIEAQLYGVTRLDPAVYLLAAASLTAVVLAAGLWPARTATRIQPVDALRVD